MKLKPKQDTITGSSTMVNLPTFSRPKFADTLVFPTDITSLTAENVSELIGKYTAMLCYAQQQVIEASVNILRYEYNISSFETQVFVTDPRLIHLEKWKRDANIKVEPKMRGYTRELNHYKKIKEVALGYVVNYERCISALSRELTRKMGADDGYRYRNLPVK